MQSRQAEGWARARGHVVGINFAQRSLGGGPGRGWASGSRDTAEALSAWATMHPAPGNVSVTHTPGPPLSRGQAPQRSGEECSMGPGFSAPWPSEPLLVTWED